MEKMECKICNKKIEGYTKSHVEYLMKQHMLTHEKKEDKKKNENK